LSIEREKNRKDRENAQSSRRLRFGDNSWDDHVARLWTLISIKGANDEGNESAFRRGLAESTESYLDCVAKLIDIARRRRANKRVYKGIFESKAKHQPQTLSSGGFARPTRFRYSRYLSVIGSYANKGEAKRSREGARNEQELLRVCSERKKRGGKGYRARARDRDSQIKIRAVSNNNLVAGAQCARPRMKNLYLLESNLSWSQERLAFADYVMLR